MIYVPDLSYACYEVIDGGDIRAYEEQPTTTGSYNYRLYYTANHYLFTDNILSIESNTDLPNCLSSVELTDNFYYRNDLHDILISFSCILFCTMFFFILVFKAFKKGF